MEKMRISPNRIAEQRKKAGLSQAQLAERIDAHWVTISKLERGRMQLTATWIEKIADALAINPVELLSYQQPKYEILVLGEIYEGSAVEYREEGAEYEELLEETDQDIGSDWLRIADDALMPFFAKGDLIRVSYYVLEELHLLPKRLGYAVTEDGRQLFCTLDRHLGGVRFDLRLIGGLVVRDMALTEFGMLTKAVFGAPQKPVPET